MVVPNPQEAYQPYDLAVEAYSRHIYWTDTEHNVINVTRMDMTAVGVVINGPHQKPRSIALAPEKGYVIQLRLLLFNAQDFWKTIETLSCWYSLDSPQGPVAPTGLRL